MSLNGPAALTPDHRLEYFDCGNVSLNLWLQRHARQAQASGSAQTFVIGDGKLVAGYYSLTVGQIETLKAPVRIRKGMGKYPIPVVVLARLAVSMRYQNQGVGHGMLKDARAATAALAQGRTPPRRVIAAG